MKQIGSWTAHGRTIDLYQTAGGFILEDSSDEGTRSGFMPFKGFRKSSEEFLVDALKWAIDVVEGRVTLPEKE